MANKKSWRTWSQDGSCFLDFERHKEGSKVTFLKINLCAIVDGRAHEVCRYDTCHGFLHVHRFWLPERKQTQDLEDPARPAGSYRDWFALAMDDLHRNGPTYIDKTIRNVRR